MQEIEHEKLELYLCCRDLKNLDLLSKSDPQIRLYVKDNNEWSLLDQTEVIQDNLNPVFDTTFIINHCPQVERHLKFEVVDIDSETAFDIIGTAETTVTEILATKKHLLSLDLAHQGEKRRGELVVRAEKIKKSCHIVTLKIAGVGLANKDGYFGKSDPFLKLYKVRQGGDQLLVHETEVINDNLNPQWEEFRIKDYKLSEGNYDSHFKIECWDFQENGTHQYIGGCETTLNELKGGKTEYELHAFRETTKVGSLKIAHFSLEERKAFSDYIKNSDQLKTIFAIDFSKANNSSRNAAPLHTKSEHDLLNEYQKALQSVSQIMLSCSETTKVSVFGFGGKLQGSSGVSDCFPWGETAEATGVNGILNAYAHVLKNIEITGPTNFAPVISEAIKAAKTEKDADSGVYTILLLFTAGDIQDMEATTGLLAQAAHLPLSIIIIGLGNGDITKMKSLDSDKGLASKKGEKVVRDLVQFVSFKGFGGDMDYLSQRVFAEIPDQVVDYMNLVQKEAGATPKGFKSKGESVFDSAPTHNVNVGLLNE